jgi:hypothetical protein
MKTLNEYILEAKSINAIPKSIKDFVKFGMRDGVARVKFGGKFIRFGISKENIGILIDKEECDDEMLDKLIKSFEKDGIRWKYDKSPDWKSLKLEDPTEDKWTDK